jgi:cold shock CspA family protein
MNIGKVASKPQKGYCFIEDLEGGDKAFLHVSKTVEHSLDDYHRGSYIEFDPQPGPKGVEAHDARLLSEDELVERGISHDEEVPEAAETVAEDVEGLAPGPLNEKHFLFANADGNPRAPGTTRAGRRTARNWWDPSSISLRTGLGTTAS